MENQKSDEALDKIYYNAKDPGSLGGVNRLLARAREKKIIGITEAKVKKYLKNQHSYSLHKQVRKNFLRNKTVVGKIDKQWQADLADIQSLATENNGFKFILTAIDVFSKYAWAIPVKDKSAKNIEMGFQYLLEKSRPRKPNKIQTDAGNEFLNNQVQKFFNTQGIHHFVSNSDKKAAVVERFNRTLKTRIWTYFTAHETNCYINVLDDIVHAYNNSKHRTIGMKPADVTQNDENRLFRKMFPVIPKFYKKKISEYDETW